MKNKNLNSNYLTEFENLVLSFVKKVPLGKITTYKFLAQAIKRPNSARAVGNALHKNPWAPQVPCHRVVNSDGSLGGYGGGAKKKIFLLESEGIDFSRERNIQVKNFDKVLYKF